MNHNYAIDTLLVEYWKQKDIMREIRNHESQMMHGHPDREEVENRIKSLESALSNLEEKPKEEK